MKPEWLFVPLCLAAISPLVSYCISKSKKRAQKYFPSPPSEAILGHLRTFPQGYPWVTFLQWGEIYGNIIHLSAAGRVMIILNDAEDAHNLLETRGSIYSDRVRAVLQGELAGMENFIAFLRYGDEFRTTRRYMSQYFNSREHVHLYPLLADQVLILLKNLSESPDEFESHLDRTSAGTVIKSTYGHDIVTKNDDYIKLAADAVISVASLGVIGLNPVDLLPFLRFVPLWLPGAGLLRRAQKAKVLIDRMVDEPYERVKSQRQAGIHQDSFTDALLDDYERDGIADERREVLMKTTAAQIYAAGAETSADALQTFIYYMMTHQDVVKKAQLEIEQVIGHDRLPTLEDRPILPYINCVLKEVLRINPPLPLGFAHVTTRDDIYKERLIPEGAFVIANIWAMMRDERYFQEPNTFNPDRFLSKISAPDNKYIHPLNTFRPDDPSSLVFGFGRRICPGRFFADASAWLVMANILTVFDILPPLDPKTGKEYIPKFEWIGGLTAKPKPFHARIVPRSEKHKILIERA